MLAEQARCDLNSISRTHVENLGMMVPILEIQAMGETESDTSLGLYASQPSLWWVLSYWETVSTA